MTKVFWPKALRLAVFATLLVASALAALTPDWAITLKAQDYTGYVDLHVAVHLDTPTRQQTLRAGGAVDLLVTVANKGPADAHQARTIVGMHGPAVAGATAGCRQDPQGFPDCELTSPLPAGGMADYLLTLSLPPTARGSVDLAIAATSDDAEAYPGQELTQLHVPIEAHVDLGTTTQCNRAYLPADKILSCQVVFRNNGQAAALQPFFLLQATNASVSNVSCNASRADLCPASGIGYFGAWNVPVLMPGDWLASTFDLSALQAYSFDWMYLQTETYSTSNLEIEDAPSDNSGLLALPVPLFRDDFEGDPAPL